MKTCGIHLNLVSCTWGLRFNITCREIDKTLKDKVAERVK